MNHATLTKSQSGFTLVELVIVIVLLGLLAATALPRFLNVTEQAQSAAVQGMQGGFATGVALVRAQFFANGGSSDPAPGGTAGAAVLMDGQTIYVSQTGWPTKTTVPNGTGTNAGYQNQNLAECLEVWNFVLQTPPIVSTGAIGSNTEYVITLNTNINGNGTDQCQFNLVVNGAADPDRYFSYEAETGRVVISPTLP